MDDITAVPDISSLSLEKKTGLINLPSELLIRICSAPELRTRELFRTLTTCKLLSAIAHPLLYTRIHLHYPRQATDLVSYLLEPEHAAERSKVRSLSFRLSNWSTYDDEEIVFHTSSAFHLLKILSSTLEAVVDWPIFWDYEDRMLESIQKLPKLQELSIWNCPIDQEQPFHRLTTCDLEFLLVNPTITSLSLERFELLHPVSIAGRINTLELYRCDMNAEQMAMLLGSVPSLEHLLLRNCSHITTYQFYTLGRLFQQIKSLQLIDMFKNPDPIYSLSRIPTRFLEDFTQLQDLHISGYILNSMALQYLPGSVRSLTITRTPNLHSGWFGMALHHLQRRMEIKVVGMEWSAEQQDFLRNVADRYETQLVFE